MRSVFMRSVSSGPFSCGLFYYCRLNADLDPIFIVMHADPVQAETDEHKDKKLYWYRYLLLPSQPTGPGPARREHSWWRPKQKQNMNNQSVNKRNMIYDNSDKNKVNTLNNQLRK